MPSNMKVKIDLCDIFQTDEECPDIESAIRRDVIESILQTIKNGVKKQIQEETNRVINHELQLAVKEQMPSIIANIMDTAYTPISPYGTLGEPTSFRKSLVGEINKQMTYKRTQYDSDKNAFTKAVDETVSENLKVFKAEMQKQVDAEYTAAVLAAAVASLKKKLSIT